MKKLLPAPVLLTGLLVAMFGITSAARAEPVSYIVQGATLDAARTQVSRVGAEPDRDLDIIHAVAAHLTESQLARLRADSSVRVYEDREIRTRGLLDGVTSVVNTVNTTLAQTALGLTFAVMNGLALCRLLPGYEPHDTRQVLDAFTLLAQLGLPTGETT